jgi:adenine/guanine phosphoribosyltransferase-like PRPP-binding protein
VAIEVFDGNVADPATLANQVKKLKERFALERVVLVGIPVKGTAAAALARRLFMPLTVFRNHDDLPF